MSETALKIIAPAFGTSAHSDAEAFGSAVWLWMHGRKHNQIPLLALDHMLLPAIELRQYALLMEESAQGASRPVGYLSWANLSAEAEGHYLYTPAQGLTAADWNSGDRMWFVDFFAPFGHSRQLYSMTAPLMASISARYMYHRSHERGVTVRTFTGTKVQPAYARQWWAERPIQASAAATTSTVAAPTAAQHP
jgi:cytolysin-activating lysine-acyltransferase